MFTLQSQKKEKEADIKQQKYYEEIKSCDVTQRERERETGEGIELVWVIDPELPINHEESVSWRCGAADSKQRQKLLGRA